MTNRPHPALVEFDQETRQKAYAFMSTLPRVEDSQTLDSYFLDEEGKQRSVCPMGACLYILSGNSKDVFPMSFAKIVYSLELMGRADLAPRISSRAFSDLIFLTPIADNALAAVFGVDE